MDLHANPPFRGDGQKTPTFNGKKSALPDELFAKLKVGDVLDDDEQMPLLFSYRC